MEETISLQALFICLCVCVTCLCNLISSPIVSNRLWAHHASEVPRDLIALSLWRGSWGVGALERWRCARSHSVVVSVSLCFCFVWMLLWCKECWLVSLEGWEDCLRGFEVFRVGKDLTWVVWVWRSWFEWFGGVYTSKGSDWRGLSEGSWFDRFGCVYSLKGSDLSGLNVERLIWEVWRCLYFQKIRLERFGRV